DAPARIRPCFTRDIPGLLAVVCCVTSLGRGGRRSGSWHNITNRTRGGGALCEIRVAADGPDVVADAVAVGAGRAVPGRVHRSAPRPPTGSERRAEVFVQGTVGLGVTGPGAGGQDLFPGRLGLPPAQFGVLGERGHGLGERGGVL